MIVCYAVTRTHKRPKQILSAALFHSSLDSVQFLSTFLLPLYNPAAERYCLRRYETHLHRHYFQAEYRAAAVVCAED
jgi:hypothetical protein